MADKQSSIFPVFSQLHSDTPPTSVPAFPPIAELLRTKPPKKPAAWNRAGLFVVAK